MSKKIRNAAIFCLSASLILNNTLIYATNNQAAEKAASTSTAANSQTTEKADSVETADTAYNPVNKKTETVYVSLDSYGKVTNTQVVNGYHLSGPATITDYGNYSKITNMTNFAEPTVENDKITWKLDGKDTNFYYQGDMKPMALPWTISVRYKLNGVETKAEDLAGQKGMVETIIDVKPNDNVSAYLKNNFFLQISTSYDMGKCLSVEAEDGIVVSLGDTKSVTYMTLPGEEATYHIYVGSNAFESSGFNFVMAPLKASVLDEVGNLKDAKERLQDAGDAIHDSINTIVDSTSNIKNGLSSFADGLQSMQKSIDAIEAEGKANDGAIDHLNEQAKKLNESLSTLQPHLENSKNLVNDVYSTTNEAVQSTKDLKTNLSEIQSYSEKLKTDLSELKKTAESLGNASGDVSHSLNNLTGKTDNVKVDLGNLSNAMEHGSEDLGVLSNNIYKLGAALKQLIAAMGSGSTGGGSTTPDPGTSTTPDAGNEAATQSMGRASLPLDPSALDTIISSASIACNTTTSILTEASRLSKDTKELLNYLNSLNSSLQKLADTINSNTSSVTQTADDLSDMVDTTSKMIDQISTVIDKVANVQDAMNKYQPDCIQSLDDMKKVIDASNQTMSAATDLTDKVHNSVKKTKGDAYSSLRESINGAISTINDTIDALDTNTDLKKNSDIIHDTVNNEWDRLEDDYNLLDYDKDAQPVSLVSPKNTEIESIQIILNTPEISIDKKAEEDAVEKAEENLTLWDRILNIFKNIF